VAQFGNTSVRKTKWPTCAIAGVALAYLGVACRPSPEEGGTAVPLLLTALETNINAAPSETVSIQVQVTDQGGRPREGQFVDFRLTSESDGGANSGGALLLSAQDLTDESGQAETQLVTGAPGTMVVQAITPRARAAIIAIEVKEGNNGSVTLRAAAPVGSPSPASVQLVVYEGRTCSGLPVREPESLPDTPRSAVLVAGTAAETFAGLSTALNHALVAVGSDDAGQAQQTGCVDLSGAALRGRATLNIEVPLVSLDVLIAGTYLGKAELQFSDTPAGAQLVEEAWQAVSGCPYAPAQFWIDCLVDALSTGPNDELDCVPSDNEGPRAASLEALRGTISSAAETQAVNCRTGLTSGGTTSVEAEIFEGITSNPRELLSDLRAQAPLIEALFKSPLQVETRLQIEPIADGWLAAHTLLAVGVGTGTSVERLQVDELGLNTPRARGIQVRREGGDVTLGSHAFTLRPGRAYQATFERRGISTLGALGNPQTLEAFVINLLSAYRNDNSLAGCAALDAHLCQLLTEQQGCLAMACQNGVDAWIKHLEASFAALDGASLDLQIDSVKATVVDTDADRTADVLGAQSAADSPDISAGAIEGEVRNAEGTTAFRGGFKAERL